MPGLDSGTSKSSLPFLLAKLFIFLPMLLSSHGMTRRLSSGFLLPRAVAFDASYSRIRSSCRGGNRLWQLVSEDAACRISGTTTAAYSSLSAYPRKQQGNDGEGLPKKFLTSNDLDASQRSYGTFSGYEEDVDSMAANYVPDYDNDDDLPGDGNMDMDVFSASPPTTRKKSSIGASATAAFPSKVSKGKEKDDDEIAEPRSPLSFISIIADPAPIDDDDDDEDYPELQDSWPRNDTNGTNVPASEASSSTYQSEATTRSTKNNANNRASKKNFNSSSEATMSAEDFRKKFSFDSVEINFPTMLASDDMPSFQPPPPVLSESSRRQDELVALETDLKRLEEEIFTANNGVEFNLASYKQVSQVLFGRPDESTSKSVLEGMAMSSILAKLILEYRQKKQRYNKLEKQEEASESKRRYMQASATTRNTAQSTNAQDTSDARDEEPLMLVDTSSFIFRAYYSMPPMHRADGLPTSAVLGFCNMINRMVLPQLLNGKQPRLVLCCDAPSPQSGGPKTIRHELYQQYKAHRVEAPMDLIPQFPFFRVAAQAYGLMWIEAPGYEADDVIASLSHKAVQEGMTVHIYSGDKDLMQLVTDATNDEGNPGKIEMIDPMTMKHWDHDSVVEKWGVAAHQLGDVLALAGDTADNIPGVPGIGPKIAAQLLQQFGTLESLLSNLDEVKQQKRRQSLEIYREQALLSQQLVRLERKLDWGAMQIDPPPLSGQDFAEPPERLQDLRMEPMNPDRILRFYDEMGFVTIKNRLLDRLKRQSKISYSYDATSSSRGSAGRGKSKGGSASRAQVEIPKPGDYDDVPF